MKKPYFQAEGARIRGDVEFGERTSVWFNAVIRTEDGPIVIGSDTNIQDNCTLHLSTGGAITIGNGVTVGHNAIIHGCTIEDNVLIGMGAIVMDGAVVRKNSMVAAGALVLSNTEIPEGSLAMGAPAKVKRMLTEEEIESLRRSAAHYVHAAEKYLSGEIE